MRHYNTGRMTGPPPLPRAAAALAWAGGALFVVALAWCFGVYLFGMPAAAAGSVSVPLTTFVVNAGLFTIFALHHSMLARSGVKRRVVTLVPPYLERSLYVWIASLLLIAVMTLWRPLPGTAYRHEGLASLPHWLLVSAGFWVTVRAAGVLDPLELAGIRQAMATRRPSAFRVIGPYHLVRHPIYLGWMLIVFGAPVMTVTRLEFAVVSSLYLILAIPFEERALVDEFGDTYRNYQRQVRWRIVPGVW